MYVIGPEGSRLAITDLPEPGTNRWVPRRKAEVIAAVRGGLISLEDACSRYKLTADELLSWQEAFDQRGLRGLRTMRIRTFYQAVRQGISLWASMEDTLVEIVALLLGTSGKKAGLILYSITNFHTSLLIIDELFNFDTRYAKYKGTWSKESNRLRALNDVRFRLAHHTTWGGGDKGTDAKLHSGKYDVRTKSPKHEPLTLEEVADFGKNAFEIGQRLKELRSEMASVIYEPSLGATSPSSGAAINNG